MSDLALEMRGVSKSFRPPGQRPRTLKELAVGLTRRATPRPVFWALQDVTISVARGECLGVVGGNGSGKSTFLRLAAGALKPTIGVVRRAGRIASLIDLGAGLHAEMTGRENVQLGGIVSGLRAADVTRRLDEIVAFAGVEEFVDSPVRCYSSGMLMRLAFAIALHSDPEIVLIDDVLGVGDEAFRPRALGRLRELRATGVTLVVVGHQLSEIRRWCDRVVWLSRGRMAAVGAPAETVAAYQLSAAAKLISIPAAAAETGALVVTAVRWAEAPANGFVVLTTGQLCALELSLSARQPVPNAAVGISVWRDDGACFYAVDTGMEGFALPAGAGRFRLLMEFGELPLLPGDYYVNVSTLDAAGRQLDHRIGEASFSVASGSGESGVVRLPHRWCLAAADAL